MQHYDYVILGGGISGLSFARLLQMHTDKTFIVLEKEATPGGLCRTQEKDGNFMDVGGGHFLFSKHREVYDFIFSHIAEDNFNRFDRVTKIHIHDTEIDYPIEQNLHQLDKELRWKYAESLLDNSPDEDLPPGFKGWMYKNLGQCITDNYMIPYNSKVWGKHLDSMGSDWIYKLPKVDIKSIFKSLIIGAPDKSVMPSHQYFYYPKNGGFQLITDAIYEPIKSSVMLGTPVNSIGIGHKKVLVNHGEFVGSKVINTIPWTSLGDFGVTKDRFFKHTGLVVTYTKRDPDFSAHLNSKTHWVYHPDQAFPYHRQFYLENYCHANMDGLNCYETNMERWGPNYHDNVVGQFVNRYAYPVPTEDNVERLKTLMRFAEMGIHGLGRWGQWQYHNSDVCIYEAMKLFCKLEEKNIL